MIDPRITAPVSDAAPTPDALARVRAWAQGADGRSSPEMVDYATARHMALTGGLPSEAPPEPPAIQAPATVVEGDNITTVPPPGVAPPIQAPLTTVQGDNVTTTPPPGADADAVAAAAAPSPITDLSKVAPGKKQAYLNARELELEQKKGVLEQDAARAKAGMEQDAVTSLGEMDARHEEQYQALQGERKKIQERRDAMMAAYQNSSVDPDRYFKSQSALGMFGTSLALIGSALTSPYGGGVSPALQMLDKAIERDIDAQKYAIDQKMKLAQQYGMDLEDNMRQAQELRVYQADRRAHMWEYAQQRIKADAAQRGLPINQKVMEQTLTAIQKRQFEDQKKADAAAASAAMANARYQQGRIDTLTLEAAKLANSKENTAGLSVAQIAEGMGQMSGIIPINDKHPKIDLKFQDPNKQEEHKLESEAYTHQATLAQTIPNILKYVDDYQKAVKEGWLPMNAEQHLLPGGKYVSEIGNRLASTVFNTKAAAAKAAIETSFQKPGMNSENDSAKKTLAIVGSSFQSDEEAAAAKATVKQMLLSQIVPEMVSQLPKDLQADWHRLIGNTKK
jgi:hypothetical protein